MLLNNLLVAAAVIASVVYAAFALGPRALRRRVLSGAGAMLRRLPNVLGLHRAALRLDTAAAQKAKSSCGGCDSCAAEQSGSAASAGQEVRIPMSKIGRR